MLKYKRISHDSFILQGTRTGGGTGNGTGNNGSWSLPLSQTSVNFFWDPLIPFPVPVPGSFQCSVITPLLVPRKY